MTTFDDGRHAEDAAAEHLRTLGYKILEQNWRTRWAEIDIVARHHTTIFFVEVKYRRRSTQGSGLEYVTPKKLQQMRFAAEQWVNNHHWTGDYRLAAIEVSGLDFQVGQFIDTIY